MLKNPFEAVEQTIEQPTEEPTSTIDLEKADLQIKEENPPPDFVTEEPVIEKNEFATFEPLPEFNSNYTHTPINKQAKLDKREVKELSDEEYHERVKALNENADNKHYVLFFGSPASGKTWIIGSVLHYMKNYIGGVVYLQTDKTTESEEELFYQLQDRFNGIVGTKINQY